MIDMACLTSLPTNFNLLNQSSEQKPREETVSMRCIIRDAGLVIGKGGSVISKIRERSHARIKISDGVGKQRTMLVSGTVDVVAKAFHLIAVLIADAAKTDASITLLIPDIYMGIIIGKGGSKIKYLAEISSAKITANNFTLPETEDRILTITGVPDAVHIAIYHVAECLYLQRIKKAESNSKIHTDNQKSHK